MENKMGFGPWDLRITKKPIIEIGFFVEATHTVKHELISPPPAHKNLTTFFNILKFDDSPGKNASFAINKKLIPSIYS